jgi:hypothetical protein
MRSGISREDEGFDILIDGVPRTFRDVQSSAFDAARTLKGSNRNGIVEVRDRATGAKTAGRDDEAVRWKEAISALAVEATRLRSVVLSMKSARVMSPAVLQSGRP